MTREINNNQDVIDSRDIIERLEELESERQELVEKVAEAQEAWDGRDGETADEEREALHEALGEAKSELDEWTEDTGDEYKALKALADECETCSDWEYGATLIRETYFTEYCQELVQDIGELPKNIPGYLVIDWDATARNLRADYSEVDFDGVAYLVRD